MKTLFFSFETETFVKFDPKLHGQKISKFLFWEEPEILICSEHEVHQPLADKAWELIPAVPKTRPDKGGRCQWGKIRDWISRSFRLSSKPDEGIMKALEMDSFDPFFADILVQQRKM
jgi:hypothetical protein